MLLSSERLTSNKSEDHKWINSNQEHFPYEKRNFSINCTQNVVILHVEAHPYAKECKKSAKITQKFVMISA